MTLNKKWLVLPGIAIGIAVLIAATVLKPTPDLQENVDNAVLVDTTPLTKQNIAPLVQGFGRITAKQKWQGIAEVKGEIIYRHPDLEVGKHLSKGTLVLKIDPLEYQLKFAQAEANLQAAKAQLTRLQQTEKNLKASLNIEQQKLTLIEQEHQRNLRLQKQKLISNSALENQLQQLLVQQNSVQQLTSSLALLPDDKKVIEGQINVNKAMLEDSQRQLQKTEFFLPFDARISSVNIEQSQAVILGANLFEAQQLGKVEVAAQLSLQDVEILRNTLINNKNTATDLRLNDLDFNANIVMILGNKEYQWPAKFTRIDSTINTQQDTIGFYLEVTQDPTAFLLSAKPPLNDGMFVKANISGLASPQFIIPERALHGDNIYIMDQQQLQIKPVKVLFRTAQGVAISGDLTEQQTLILNDIIPAIAGMRVKRASVKAVNNSEALQ